MFKKGPKDTAGDAVVNFNQMFGFDDQPVHDHAHAHRELPQAENFHVNMV